MGYTPEQPVRRSFIATNDLLQSSTTVVYFNNLTTPELKKEMELTTLCYPSGSIRVTFQLNALHGSVWGYVARNGVKIGIQRTTAVITAWTEDFIFSDLRLGDKIQIYAWTDAVPHDGNVETFTITGFESPFRITVE